MAMLNYQRVLYIPIHIIIISHYWLIKTTPIVTIFSWWWNITMKYPMIIAFRPYDLIKSNCIPPYSHKYPHYGWSWLTTMNHFLTRIMSLLYIISLYSMIRSEISLLYSYYIPILICLLYPIIISYPSDISPRLSHPGWAAWRMKISPIWSLPGRRLLDVEPPIGHDTLAFSKAMIYPLYFIYPLLILNIYINDISQESTIPCGNLTYHWEFQDPKMEVR